MGGGAVKDGKITASVSAGSNFKSAARPLTDDEKLFLDAYKAKDLGHSNVTVEVTNKMVNEKDRPPAVQEALKRVMEKPGEYGLKPEEHSWLEQKILGEPKKDFKSTGYQAGSPG
jgi:hypothetical protein